MRVCWLGVSVALLVACGPQKPPRARVVVAAVRQPATSLFFVAQSLGCFEREGLDVEERTFELGRDALALLLAGGADAAIAYETPVLRAAFSDDRLRILTTLHTSTRNTRLVARRAAGVAGFGDLAGKRLGFARGTNAEFFVGLALELGAVPRGEVELHDLSPAASVAALGEGELDGAVLSDPFAGHAERALGDGAAVLRTDLYTEVSLLVTREDVLAGRGRPLRALLRGLVCAERHALAHPDDARARVLGRFPALSDEALREQLGRVSWGLGLDNVVHDVLRRERDALAPGAVPGRPPDLGRLIDPRPLEEVMPDAVMLLARPDGTQW